MDIASFTNGETLLREFKDDSKSEFNDSKLVEAVVGMANAEGGEILVGVSDNGKVLGSKKLGTKWKNPESVQGMILSNIQPSVEVKVDALAIDSKEVLRVLVPDANTTVGTKSGKYLIRRMNSKGHPQNLPMTTDEIIGKISRIGTGDFSSTTLNNASIDHIDLDLVSLTAKQILRQSKLKSDKQIFSGDAVEVLKTLGLVDQNQRPNIACLLLFGTEDGLRTKIANHTVRYQEFSSKGEILENRLFHEPIAKIFPKLMAMPRFLVNSDEFRLNGRAVIIPEYSSDSIREAIANALVHRDYTLFSGIQIQAFEKELQITSPGSFPNGVNESNLLSVSPSPRNRRLAEAMCKLKFVESSGRGIDLIFMGQAQYGRPAPDYSGSGENSVCVRLIGGKANLRFCKFILSSIENPQPKELLLLNALFLKGYLLEEDAAEVIQQNSTMASQVLYSLHTKGLVEMRNEEPTRYLLKASVHHTLRDVVRPSRLRKIDIPKYKKTLLNELNRGYPVKTNDLADVVGLSPSQTYRLLCQLRSEKLVVMGNRGKKWKLPS